MTNNECQSSKSCINKKCTDPCARGVCGSNSKCYVVNHIPMCECENGYNGNGYIGCDPISMSKTF